MTVTGAKRPILEDWKAHFHAPSCKHTDTHTKTNKDTQANGHTDRQRHT